MAHTPHTHLTTENAAAAAMPIGLKYADRCSWIAKRDALVRVASAAPIVASADEADFETTITVVTERGLIFVVIDDGKTEKHHRVLDADEVATIIRKRGISAGNVYSENISDGFMRRVRTLISVASADTVALLELESAAGCNYFETLDSAPIAPTLPRVAPTPIWIHTKHEAAFAVACIKRRKIAQRAA